MRSLIFTLILGCVFLFSACSKNSDNPASPNSSNALKGTWTMTYYGNQSDTLSVTLNIDGSDNKLGGNGSFAYREHNNGGLFTYSATDVISGSYTTDSIDGSIGSDFKFSGKKSGNNYTGSAVFARGTNDTLYISNVTYIASN